VTGNYQHIFEKYDDVFYSAMVTEAYIHLFAQFISTDEHDSESANSVTYCVPDKIQCLYPRHIPALTDTIYYHLTSSLGY